jgi:hypothetical protein
MRRSRDWRQGGGRGGGAVDAVMYADLDDVGQVLIAVHQLALVLHLDAVNMPLTHVALVLHWRTSSQRSSKVQSALS